MALQQRISLARNQAQVGRMLDVLVEAHGEMEGMAPAGKNGHGAKTRPRRQPVSLARSYRDAPEVDGLVVIPALLPLGKMAPARITGAIEYDLVGEAVGETVQLPCSADAKPQTRERPGQNRGVLLQPIADQTSVDDPIFAIDGGFLPARIRRFGFRPASSSR